MVKGLGETIKFNVKGTIKTGYKTVNAYCPVCKRDIKAIKPYDNFICPVCGKIVIPPSGAKEGLKSTPFFILPKDIKEKFGKPSSLNIIPAYREIEHTFPTSYTKYAANKMIFCSGDGETAKRYDKDSKEKKEVPCSPDNCPEKLNNTCKLTATFYVILPDIDMFNAYRIIPKSMQTIINIMSTLNKLKGHDGLINRTICELKIIEQKRKETGMTYYILQLLPPAVSLSEIKQMKDINSAMLIEK